MNLSREAAAEALQPAGAIYFTMDEADVRRILAYPLTMVGSDGLPHYAFPHPRLWGTFPRVLGHYSRDVGLFPLEQAVRRMTAVPARVFNLEDRGTLEAINIEGNLDLPQMLFITSRDQYRYRDHLHREYQKNFVRIGREAKLPRRLMLSKEEK